MCTMKIITFFCELRQKKIHVSTLPTAFRFPSVFQDLTIGCNLKERETKMASSFMARSSQESDGIAFIPSHK